MDCRDEWADRVNQEQIERVLQLGEFLMMLPADQKPMRMTLAASKLWGEGVARSQEEAYVMLSEACVNSEVMNLIEGYDTAMHQAEKHMDALKAEVLRLYEENQQLKAQLGIPILPIKKKTTGRIPREA